MKWMHGVVVVAMALAAAGCCGGKENPAPDPSVTPGKKPGASSGGGIGTGVVNAKKTATNQTGRGIVRTAPNFQATEVVRLDPGTQVTITATAPGGWYAITWPSGNGFIHGDVMQVTMN